MTFEEVLNEAVALLQRQGRVAYRVLKRQFDLEDDYFEDLKEAILYAYPRSATMAAVSSGVATRARRRHRPLFNPLRTPRRFPPTPNAGSSPCCSATWSIPPSCHRNSIPKSTGI
jgi:hypothetical protein